ncbi:MAG: hypothetical protein ACREO9_06410, partial [Lysobacterales bacterium]
LSGVLGVFGGDGKIALDVLKHVSAAVGTLEKRFQAVQEQDSQFAFEQVKSEMQVMFITISNSLLPSIVELSKKLKELVARFKELPPETQTMIVRTLALVAAIGPLLILLGSVTNIISILIPLFVRLGAVMTTGMPWAALALGVGLVLKAIGDAYVEKLEQAIRITEKFKTTINSVATTDQLVTNLKATNQEVSALLKDRENAAARLGEIQARIDKIEENSFKATFQKAELGALAQARADELANMQQVEIELANLIKLRDMYTGKVTEALLAEQKLAAVQTGSDEGEPLAVMVPAISPEDWQALLEAIDPVTESLKDLRLAKEMIDKQFAAKNIDLTEYKRLIDVLQKSKLAFDALNPALLVMREMDAAMAANLKSNMDYVDSLVTMKMNLEGLKQVIDPVGAALANLAAARKVLKDASDAKIIDPAEFERLSVALESSSLAVQDLGDVFERAGSEWLFALNQLANL